MAELKIDISDVVNNAIEKIKQEGYTVQKWIPCSERLPEQSGEYLVYTEYEDVFKCYFETENDPEEDECQWGFYQDYRDPDTLGWAGTTWTAVETVTHWMPLPEPPKSEENSDE